MTVAVSLLAVLLVSMDWPTMLSHAQRMTPALVVLVMVAFAVQLAVSSWKWQWALRIHGLYFPYVYLTRVLFIGFFLNNFLPTSIGGDAYRVYRTLPPMPGKSRAISAVLLERVVGLFALLLLGLAGAFALYSSSRLARAYVLLATCGAAVVVLGIALLKLWRAPALPQSRWLAPIRENLRSITQAGAKWIPLIAISLVFQAQAILIVFVLFGAIDADVSLSQTALIASAAGLAAIVPFSINGLGIVEATFAGTAVAVGASYEAALLVALLIRVLVIPLTLLAGLVYAFEPVHARDVSTPFPNIRSSG